MNINLLHKKQPIILAALEKILSQEGILADHENFCADFAIRPSTKNDLWFRFLMKETEQDKVLSMPINLIMWSGKVASCLKKADVITVGDLVRRTEHDLGRFWGTGKTSIVEIKNQLWMLGLCLGMNIPPGPKERRVIAGFTITKIFTSRKCWFPTHESLGYQLEEKILELFKTAKVAILRDLKSKATQKKLVKMFTMLYISAGHGSDYAEIEALALLGNFQLLLD